MKKYLSIITIILVLCLTFSLYACNEEPTKENENIQNNEEIEQSYLEKEISRIYSTASKEAQTIKSVHELAKLTSINYTIDGAGPITVTPCTLNGEPHTLITLGGTQFVEGQATRIEESQAAAFGNDNDYLKAVVKLFLNGTVPKNKPVIITGISLGGMIAQQLIGSYEIKDFKISYVITFGSPLTTPLYRYGTKVVRFADTYDIVPSSGEMPLPIRGIKKVDINESHKKERIQESGKHTNVIECHALSYVSDECWAKYDFIGDELGTNTLITLAPLTFYPAPILTPTTEESTK